MHIDVRHWMNGDAQLIFLIVRVEILESMDISATYKSGDDLCQLLDNKVDEIRENNVFQ